MTQRYLFLRRRSYIVSKRRSHPGVTPGGDRFARSSGPRPTAEERLFGNAGRLLQLHQERRVRPQAFELVEVALGRRHDMDDDRSKVEQQPVRVG
jgi:hypothetical protein